MNTRGHNERSFRLDALAAEAREGLEKVEQGQEFTIGGWLAYGHALNEGRALFPGDREFGEWVALCQLDTPDRHERASAMWAAANADQFEEARAAGNARTVRGIYAKWKEIEAEREAARIAEEAKAQAEAARETSQPGSAGLEYPEPVSGSKPAQEEISLAAQENKGETAEPVEQGTTPSKPDQEPDPYRVGLSSLSRQGLEDEIAGLRAENDELRAKAKLAQAERDRFKAANKELMATDAGKVIAKLQSENRSMRYARDEAQKAVKREEYKRKLAEKELAAITGQEIKFA